MEDKIIFLTELKEFLDHYLLDIKQGEKSEFIINSREKIIPSCYLECDLYNDDMRIAINPHTLNTTEEFIEYSVNLKRLRRAWLFAKKNIQYLRKYEKKINEEIIEGKNGLGIN